MSRRCYQVSGLVMSGLITGVATTDRRPPAAVEPRRCGSRSVPPAISTDVTRLKLHTPAVVALMPGSRVAEIGVGQGSGVSASPLMVVYARPDGAGKQCSVVVLSVALSGSEDFSVLVQKNQHLSATLLHLGKACLTEAFSCADGFGMIDPNDAASSSRPLAHWPCGPTRATTEVTGLKARRERR